MSRNSFGRWGLDLNRNDFAAALAGLGTERIPDWQAYEQVAGDDRVEWSVSESRDWPDAGYLATRWRANLAHHQRPICLKIRPRPHIEEILPWIIRQLLRYAGVDAVSIDPQFSPAYVHWTWPLQIGLVPGPGTKALQQHLKQMWTVASLSRTGELVEACDRPVDILLLPWDLRESLQRVLTPKLKLRASFLVILGEVPAAWHHTRCLTDSLAAETGAQGVCLAPTPETKRASWVESLMQQISHDVPLDLCVMTASRQMVSGAGRFPVPYLFATDLLLAESRLSAFTRRLGARMAALGDRKVEISEGPAAMLDLPAGPQAGAQVAEKLEARAREFRFSHESAEASALAELSERANAVGAESTPAGVEPRWIQGRMFEIPAGSGPNQTESETRLLRADVAYRFKVRVGPTEASWIAPSTSPFPDWELPQNRQGYWLQVIFSEPHHASQPQIGKIFLPPDGPSSTCEFFFRPIAGNPEFQARILVLFENRVLQTALLEGNVHTDAETGERKEVTLRIEDAIRPEIAALDSRQPFDAALLVNHTPAGTAAATSVIGEEARLFSLENMDQAITQIADKLSDLAVNVDTLPKDLSAPATVELLRFLAFHGRLLYDALEDQLGIGRLAGIRRVQLVSALPESFLPLELLYEKPVPDRDAGLCPKSKEALKKGSCKDCLLTDRSPAPLICPIGFWSTTRTIERHAIKRLDQHLTASEFALQADPVGDRKNLSTLGAALFGASERVRSSDVKSLLATLQKQTDNKARQVSTWKDWETEIAQTKPSLLVILCHTLDDPDFQVPAIEIGKDVLASGYIGPRYVRPTPEDAPPVVLLLGCESLCRTLPFQGFVPPLRRGGAAIVVATISTVLGRHVAPVAKAIVSLLKRELKKPGTHSLGDVMPVLRRQMLAKGIPMVFALFAYGDADWQLKAN